MYIQLGFEEEIWWNRLFKSNQWGAPECVNGLSPPRVLFQTKTTSITKGRERVIYIHYADCRIYMHRRRGRTHKRAASSQIYLPARESVSVAYISTFLAAGKEKRVPLSRTFDGSFFFCFCLSPLLHSILTQQHMCTTTTYTCYPPLQHYCTTSLIQWFIAFKQLFFSFLQ